MFPENWLFEGVSFSGDIGYFFYSSWDGGDVKHERLFTKYIDLKTGAFFDEDAEEFITVDGKIRMSQIWGDGLLDVSYGSWNGADKFRFKKNEKTGNLSIRYTRKPKLKSDKKNFDVYGIKVVDSDFKDVFTAEYEMPYTETEMEVLDYILGNDNSIKLLIKKYFDRSGDENKKDQINYDLEVLELLPDGNIKSRSIDIPNFYVTDLKMNEEDNGTISCVGYYSFGGRKAQTNGVFLFKINPNGELIVGSVNDIPVSLINKYSTNGDSRKNERKAEKDKNTDLTLLELRNVHFSDDGSVTIIGEGSVEKATNKYYYHWYLDAYIIKLNPDGNIAWMEKIGKKQKGGSPKYAIGFQYFFKNDKHIIAYLDNFRNLNLPDDKAPDTHLIGHGGFLFVTTIDDATGNKSTSKVLDVRKTKSYREFIDFETGTFFINDNNLHVETMIPNKKRTLVSIEVD